jgi:hypothetical protein
VLKDFSPPGQRRFKGWEGDGEGTRGGWWCGEAIDNAASVTRGWQVEPEKKRRRRPEENDEGEAPMTIT